MLCEKCSNIHFKKHNNYRHKRYLATGEDDPNAEFLVYRHHENLRELIASSKLGCHFCAMMVAGFSKETRGDPLEEFSWNSGSIVLAREVNERWISEERGLETWNAEWGINIECGRLTVLGSSVDVKDDSLVAMLEGLTNDTRPDFGQSQLTTLPKKAQECEISRLGIAGNYNPGIFSLSRDVSTLSLASLHLASHWLQNCLRNHKICNTQQRPVQHSSRYIDISEAACPRLTTRLLITEPYATLSYEWGESVRFVTTIGNVRYHQECIPLDKLPTTFQESMEVARFLGFRFIWIDALCIIQDSNDDKESQIWIMDQIFRNSNVTIFAATGGIHSRLAVERDPRLVKPCRLNVKSSLRGQTVQGFIHASFDQRNLHWRDQPLFERGWVAQEQILAPRALVFGAHELAWQCICGDANESSPDQKEERSELEWIPKFSRGTREYSRGADGFHDLRLVLSHRNPRPDRHRRSRDNHFDHWYRFIIQYCQRQLTFPTDVLPAIAGLANALSAQHCCEYRFGLWMDDLQVGLLWHVSDRQVGSTNMGRSVQEVQEVHRNSQLPSWSWASCWGYDITFRMWQLSDILVESLGIHLAAGTDDSTHYESSKVSQWELGHDSTNDNENLSDQSSDNESSEHSWHTENSWRTEDSWSSVNSDLRARLKDTDLVLRGYVKEAWLGFRERAEEYREQGYEDGSIHVTGPFEVDCAWIGNVHDITTSQIIGRIALDAKPSNDPSFQHIYCLLCAARKNKEKWKLTCLGLVKKDKINPTFTRIGLVFIEDQDWFGPLSSCAYANYRRRTTINETYNRKMQTMIIS